MDTILEAIDIKMSKEPKEYSTQAEVLRVDGKTAWVHIPGGAPETPAKETIACKKGDIVQVHVENGVATLTGNGTAPPTDDAAANAAQATATAAEVLAQEGKDEADNTSQYFWYQNGTGSEAGAHVTEIPGEDFRRKPQGGNLLMKSTGVFLRYALTKLVQIVSTGMSVFEPTDSTNPVLQALSTGVVVGKETGYHIVIGGSEVSFYKDANTMLFTISLSQYGSALKQSSSNSDGALYLTDKDAQLEVYEEASGNEYHTAYTEHRIHNSSATTDIQANWHGTSQHVAHLVLDANSTSGRAQISATDELLLSSASMKFRGGKLFNTFTATGTVSLGANSGGNVTVSGTVPTGYTPIAVQGIESEHNQSALIGKFTLASTGANISMRNVSTTSYSNMTVTATILCINSTFM